MTAPCILTGAPVCVDLNTDGTVTVTVYLGEVTQEDDTDITDAQRSAIAAAIATGNFTVNGSPRA